MLWLIPSVFFFTSLIFYHRLRMLYTHIHNFIYTLLLYLINCTCFKMTVFIISSIKHLCVCKLFGFSYIHIVSWRHKEQNIYIYLLHTHTQVIYKFVRDINLTLQLFEFKLAQTRCATCNIFYFADVKNRNIT